MSKLLCALGYYSSIFNKNNNQHDKCQPAGFYGLYVSLRPYETVKPKCSAHSKTAFIGKGK